MIHENDCIICKIDNPSSSKRGIILDIWLSSFALPIRVASISATMLKKLAIEELPVSSPYVSKIWAIVIVDLHSNTSPETKLSIHLHHFSKKPFIRSTFCKNDHFNLSYV